MCTRRGGKNIFLEPIVAGKVLLESCSQLLVHFGVTINPETREPSFIFWIADDCDSENIGVQVGLDQSKQTMPGKNI